MPAQIFESPLFILQQANQTALRLSAGLAKGATAFVVGEQDVANIVSALNLTFHLHNDRSRHMRNVAKTVNALTSYCNPGFRDGGILARATIEQLEDEPE